MSEQNENFTETTQDALVTAELAKLYAAPDDPGYWSDLHVRTLARIADSDPGLWWMFLGRWARAGIVAAAAALLVAGIASSVRRSEQNQVAIGLEEGPTPVTAMEKVSAMVGISEEEAALRYVLSLTEGNGR
jgi:hypothetical protein